MSTPSSAAPGPVLTEHQTPGRGGGAPAAPVVVVGAGPVGQTAALLLARHGVRVLVLDARPGREAQGSRASCQQRDVLDVWDWCGAGQIAREGLTWTRTRTYYRDHELVSVDLPDPGASTLPPFVNLPQSRTEEILDELVDASPLVEVRWGHEVVDLQQVRGGGVVLTARTVAGPRRVEGRYVVACAGARGGTVRSLLDVDFRGRTFDDAFLVCDVLADPFDAEQERHVYFDPPWHRGGQTLVLPCPGSVYRVDWQVRPDLDLEAARADGTLERMVTQVVGDQHEVLWASVYRFHARLASRFRTGNVFLAGDVAHLVPPFGARGLNSGVADVDNLAWKLAAVLQGWAPDTLLDSYADERRAAAEENLEVTSATMDFLVPRTPDQETRRHALLERAVHDPDARAQVDGGRLAEPFWYVASPLTTPDPSRPWPGRPTAGSPPAPVPGVILPDAEVLLPPERPTDQPRRLRLRELVRGRVSVLTDGAPAARAAGAALRTSLPPGAPVGAFDLPGLPGSEPVLRALGWEAGDLWLVRPDAHTAARVRTTEELVGAALRLLSLPAPGAAGPA